MEELFLLQLFSKMLVLWEGKDGQRPIGRNPEFSWQMAVGLWNPPQFSKFNRDNAAIFHNFTANLDISEIRGSRKIRQNYGMCDPGICGPSCWAIIYKSRCKYLLKKSYKLSTVLDHAIYNSNINIGEELSENKWQ